MAGKEEQELRFSMESIRYLDRVKNHAWQSLRERAITKVTREGRNVVMEDDIRACLDEALQQVAREEKGASLVGS